VQEKVAEEIIEELMIDDYLNEERFAKLYASSKFRNNNWGKNKIYFELRKKQVPDLYVQIGLEEIEEEEYKDKLRALLAKKNKEIKVTNIFSRKKKLITFAMGKGYRYDLARKIADEITSS
jgi:regulatory protein